MFGKPVYIQKRRNGPQKMGATSKITQTEEHMTNSENGNKEVQDDLSDVEVKAAEVPVDDKKLAALKAKSQAKQNEAKMSAKIVAKKERSLQIGFCGVGQAGGRLALAWSHLGYPACAINTTNVDLKNLDLPDSSKLLLEQTVGGAARDTRRGEEIANSYKPEILEFISSKLSDTQVNVFCTSGGGGSGAGSIVPVLECLLEINKPIVVILALPMSSEDASVKLNSLESLSKLAKFAQAGKISNLIVVDNAKLESIYSNVSPLEFFNVANKAIVAPLDVFNTMSSTPSAVKGIDESEFTKLLLAGGLSIYGEMFVENFKEDTALAEAVIENLGSNLLAGNFDLKQATTVGVMFLANKQTWSEINSSAVNYAMSVIGDLCNPSNLFRGIYETNDPTPGVRVYSMFSGLGLPMERVEQLKEETKELTKKTKEKDDNRNLNLKLDVGQNETVTAAQKVKDLIASKSSPLGKLLSGGKVDRRK